MSTPDVTPAEFATAVDRLHALAHVTIGAGGPHIHVAVCELLGHMRLFLPDGQAASLPADHPARLRVNLLAAVLLGRHDSAHPACLNALSRGTVPPPPPALPEADRRPSGDPSDPRGGSA